VNRTRWKMMIGALGLSLGGLAAVAGVPAANGVSCAGTPTHTVARVSEPPTPPTPSPKPIELPALTPPQLPTLELPLTPVVPAVPTPVAPEPSPLPVMPVAILPTPPMIPVPVPAPAPARIEPTAPTPPVATVPPVTHFRTSVGSGQVRATVALAPEPLPPNPTAFPPLPTSGLPEPKPQYVVSSDAPTPARAAETAAVPIPAMPPVESAKVAERKLKVILAMGDERPRFEVRDGDEVYLKVVCDRVEVKSPGEGGVSVSTMSATGKVTFVTPGGEGTCDQLAVLPGTGQVVVTGKVTFTYNWGKVETTVTGEKMNFRLGSNTVTPAAAQNTGNVTGVPTSYTRTR